MDSTRTSRRRFLQSVTASAGALALPRAGAASLPEYTGPNVVIVCFGGGVRRRETIDPEHTYAPYLCKELTKRGTFYPNMVLDSLENVETGHGQGTLYILTGKYAKYRDVHNEVLGERFEAEIPTVLNTCASLTISLSMRRSSSMERIASRRNSTALAITISSG